MDQSVVHHLSTHQRLIGMLEANQISLSFDHIQGVIYMQRKCLEGLIACLLVHPVHNIYTETIKNVEIEYILSIWNKVVLPLDNNLDYSALYEGLPLVIQSRTS